MKQLLVIILCALCIFSVAFADTMLNPFTGKMDFVGAPGDPVETNNLETKMTGVLEHEIPIGTSADTATYTALSDCDGATNALTYDTATHAFGCHTITGAAHDAVTLAGQDYLSLSTQQITANLIKGSNINWDTIENLSDSNINWTDFDVPSDSINWDAFPNNQGYLTAVNWDDAILGINWAVLDEDDLSGVNWDAYVGGGSISGTDTHVMFFDGANTPAGDAGFVYNKTTDSATLSGSLTTGGAVGGVTLVGATSDPCGTLAEGTIFYNTTSNYMCYCNGTNDVKMSDDTTACF